MTRVPRAVLIWLVLTTAPALAEDSARPATCVGSGMVVQVLGSGGGADLAGARASSAYVVWLDGKARVVVDFGVGAALRFSDSGARALDLDAILLTQLHADHTLDFPALVALATLEGRVRSLPLYGPTGNRVAPSTVTFVRTLFDGTRGAYRYLSDVLNPLAKNGFKLEPHDVRERAVGVGVRRDQRDIIDVYANDRLSAAATYVAHGGMPALAWRVRVGERSVVFSGDTSGEGGRLEALARDADLLIADHAAPEGAQGLERYQHAPPSVIARIAAQAEVKRVVLAHRTRRTLGAEEASLAEIRKHYAGPVAFADDLDCFVVP